MRGTDWAYFSLEAILVYGIVASLLLAEDGSLAYPRSQLSSCRVLHFVFDFAQSHHSIAVKLSSLLSANA